MSALALFLVPALAAIAEPPAVDPSPTVAPATPSDGAPGILREPAAEPTNSVEEPWTSGHRLSLKGAIGGSYAQYFGVPVYAGELSLAVGGRDGRRKNWSAYGGVQIGRGRTEHGLDLWTAHVTPSMDWAMGLLRLGVEGRLGYANLARATRDDSLESLSVGAGAYASFDVVPFSDTDALYLQATGRGDYYEEPLVFSASLSLGYRWDSTR